MTKYLKFFILDSIFVILKIRMSSLWQQSIIQMTSRGINILLGLGVVVLTTRALGPAGFGVYTTITAFLQFVSLLIGFGMSMVVARELGEGRFSAPTVLGNALSLRLITAIGAFALAPLIAITLGYSSIIVNGIALTSIGFCLGSIAQTFTGLFQARLASHKLAVAEISGRIGLLGVTWWAVYSHGSLTKFLWAIVIANTITCVLAGWQAYKLEKFKLNYNLEIWRALWQTIWPLILTTSLNVIYFKADTIILSLLKSSTDVGLYGAAYNVLEALLALPAIIGGLVLPQLAKAQAQQNTALLQKLYTNTFDILLALGLTAMVGLNLVGTNIMTLIAGPSFVASGQLLGILGIAIFCSFIGNAAGYVLFALKKQKQLIPIFALGVIVALPMYFILIPRYSYWGAAWSTVIVEVVVNMCMIILLWRVGFKPSHTRWFKIILTTLALGLGLWIPLPLILKIICGVTLYLGSLWGLRLFPHQLSS